MGDSGSSVVRIRGTKKEVSRSGKKRWGDPVNRPQGGSYDTVMVTVSDRTGDPLFGAALMFTVLVPELKLQESVEEMELVVALRFTGSGCRLHT